MDGPGVSTAMASVDDNDFGLERAWDGFDFNLLFSGADYLEIKFDIGSLKFMGI